MHFLDVFLKQFLFIPLEFLFLRIRQRQVTKRLKERVNILLLHLYKIETIQLFRHPIILL